MHEHAGQARSGRLLGVLGPSGSGKSTLLHALAGVSARGLCVSGRVWDAGSTIGVGLAEGTVALLEQDDSFFSELTVSETVRFAAELGGLSPAAAARDADMLLARVGLTTIAAHKVGERRLGSSGAAVSGGERRRLAVACAIAGEECNGLEAAARGHRSRTLLADEPTTGLDSFQAARVVALLRELAVSRRCATVATLHQPRASIWRTVDDVMLVGPGGRVIFCGPSEDVRAYFEALGYPCPTEGVNPSEFLIDLVSVNTEDAEHAALDQARIDSLAFAFQAKPSDVDKPPPFYDGRGSTMTALSNWRAFQLLFWRSVKQTLRDRVTNTLRLLGTVGLAIAFGAQFGKLDDGGPPSARSVASRVSLLSFGTISMAFVGEMRALDRFGKEKAVVGRERAAGRYGSGAYLAAKAFAELPSDCLFAGLFGLVVRQLCGLRAPLHELVGAYCLVALASAALGLAIGAAVPHGEQALALGGPVMVVHMLTGVIDPAGQAARAPGLVMGLMRSLSPIRAAIEALCVAELGGQTLARSAADAPRMGGLALVRTGDEVLQRLGIEYTFGGAAWHLLRLTALHLLLGAIALWCSGPRFASSASSKPSAVASEVASRGGGKTPALWPRSRSNGPVVVPLRPLQGAI